jgi:hypothetical protein
MVYTASVVRMVRGASTGVLALAACGQLIGADDYASAPPRYHGLFLRAGGQACEACVDAACSEDLSRCVADPGCDAVLACLATEAGWYDACEVPLSLDWDVAYPMRTCFVASCAEPCNLGRLWSCAGEFPQPQPRSGTKSATVDVKYSRPYANSEPFAGIEVVACGGIGPDCSEEVDRQVTDSEGRARLSVPFGMTGTLTPRPGFRGFLELSSGDPAVFPTLRFFRRPPTWDTREWATVFDAQLASQALGALGQTPGLGAVGLEIADCFGVAAPDIRFELSSGQGDAISPIVYFDANGIPSMTLDRTSSVSLAAVPNVPPGHVFVTARLAETNRIVVDSRREFVRADTLSVIWLGPDPRP